MRAKPDFPARLDLVFPGGSGGASPTDQRITVQSVGAKTRLVRRDPLGRGVLVDPTDSVVSARDAFYAAFLDVAPNVLVDLETSCMPELALTSDADLQSADPGRLRDVSPVGPAVEAWARKHRLACDWVVEDALWALLVWEDPNCPGRSTRLKLWSMGPSAPLASRPNFFGRVGVSFAWNVDSQPRAEFRARLVSEFAGKLDRELDRIEGRARAAGWRTLGKKEVPRHMRWLVQRVVLRMSAEAVSKRDAGRPTVRNVEMAVREAATLIGLDVPRRKAGRPRKDGPTVIADPRR